MHPRPKITLIVHLTSQSQKNYLLIILSSGFSLYLSFYALRLLLQLMAYLALLTSNIYPLQI